MKKNKIDKIIESADSDAKESARKKLHDRLNLEQTETPQTTGGRGKIGIKSVLVGIAGICVVCLAIILPIALRETPTPTDNRYNFVSTDLNKSDLGCTVKEYAEQTGKGLLYLDWYSNADDCITVKYFLPDKADEIIYITEDIYNGETGDHVSIAVVERNIYINNLEFIKDVCINEQTVDSTQVKWSHSSTEACAYFEYGDHKYYIRLTEPMSEQAVLDIVSEML